MHDRQAAQRTKVACDDGKQKSHRVNQPLRYNHFVVALRTWGKNVIRDHIVLITQQKHCTWQDLTTALLTFRKKKIDKLILILRCLKAFLWKRSYELNPADLLILCPLKRRFEKKKINFCLENFTNSWTVYSCTV